MSERHHILEHSDSDLGGAPVLPEIKTNNEVELIYDARNALFLAILLSKPHEAIDVVVEQEILYSIADAMSKWQSMDDGDKTEVWAASKARTARDRGVHSVLEQLQIMAGKKPMPHSKEIAEDTLDPDVYDLAADTFLLMLFEHEQKTGGH